jgi:hypothetical protein
MWSHQKAAGPHWDRPLSISLMQQIIKKTGAVFA